MDSLKIGCFLAVAETQSFSKAADRLFKNQSVVSRQVAALEKELGVKLFIRNSRNISLTPAGQVFKSGILKIAKNYESLLENTAAAEKGYRGEIKLGMHPGNLYLQNVIPIIRAFEIAHPEICVTLTSAYSGELSPRLDDGQIDFIFWRWEEYSNPWRGCLDVFKTEHGLLFSRDHPVFAAEKGSYDLIDFKNETFLLLPDHVAPGLGRRLIRKCIESGFEPKTKEVPDLETSILMVSMQRGIMGMNDLGYFAHNEAFRFIRIPQLGSSAMSFIWDKKNTNPSLGVFLDFLKQNY